jgi:hypothetical protein
MSEAERLDRLESVEAIRQLVARYALSTDSRDLGGLVALFGAPHGHGRAAPGLGHLARLLGVLTEGTGRMRP